MSETGKEELPTPPEPVTRASKEIMALSIGADVRPVIPRSIEEVFRLAQLIVNAGLAPASYESEFKAKDGGFVKAPDPQKVTIGIMTALELGVPPMQGLSGIAIINNRPSVWGDLAVALIQSKNLIARHERVETGTFPEDDYKVTVRYWRRGEETPYEGEFSIADAKKADLWLNARKKPWIHYPKRMIFNRARAFALRDGFSDALKGIAIAEEMQDLPEEAKGPADTSFLVDDASPAAVITHRPETSLSGPVAGAGEPSADQPSNPTPDEAEAPDETKDDLAGYTEAAGAVMTIAGLTDIDREVKALLKDRGRDDLLPWWNSLKLERERAIGKLKTK